MQIVHVNTAMRPWQRVLKSSVKGVEDSPTNLRPCRKAVPQASRSSNALSFATSAQWDFFSEPVWWCRPFRASRQPVRSPEFDRADHDFLQPGDLPVRSGLVLSGGARVSR